MPIQEHFLKSFLEDTEEKEKKFLIASVQGGMIPSLLRFSAETIAKWELVKGVVIEAIPFATDENEREMILDSILVFSFVFCFYIYLYYIYLIYIFY